jgi:hypothetical protein
MVIFELVKSKAGRLPQSEQRARQKILRYDLPNGTAIWAKLVIVMFYTFRDNLQRILLSSNNRFTNT